MLKSLVSRLPNSLQHELKRLHWRRHIARGTFSAGEPEFERLDRLLVPGAVAIDVGANVGQYTRRMSELVGRGRVIALEPVAETFALLSANCRDLPNVSLLNAAASDEAGEVLMDLPADRGVSNYYRASIASAGSLRALAIPLDNLSIDRVDLIKIDAEGHDLAVLRGAQGLLRAFRPSLIVEADTLGKISEWLCTQGYVVSRETGSPNIVAFPRTRRAFRSAAHA